MKSLLSILIIFFPILSLAQQETVITGKLLGANRKPMAMAHAHLLKAPNPKPVVQVQAKGDGSFEIRTKVSGLLVVEFTGVGHNALDVPLLVEKPAMIGLNVSLAAYDYVDNPQHVMIMTDLDNFSYDNARPMQKQPDGTYAVDLATKKDKLAYEIVGVEKTGRTINGTQSDEYQFDDGGDYRSIVRSRDGKVHIVFDPKKTFRSTADPEVKFTDPTTTIAKVTTVHLEMMRRAIIFSNASKAYADAGNDPKKFTYDWSADLAAIVSRLGTEKDPVVRHALLLDYLDVKSKNAANADPALGAQALREIPPDSKLWMIPTLRLIKVARDLSGDEAAYEAYLNRFLEKNPDSQLKTSLLQTQLVAAQMQGDEKQLKLNYDLALKYFAGTPFGDLVREHFSPTIAIAVGKQVPSFAVKALGDTTKIYTNATFKGKVYLLDFWATWCGPCLGEMAGLHNAYQKFKSRNFEILSLSLDQRPEDVTRFCSGQWKMPWLHTFVGEDKKILDKFGIVAIPRPILVDASGKIIALEDDLRGAALERTLTKFLGESKQVK